VVSAWHCVTCIPQFTSQTTAPHAPPPHDASRKTLLDGVALPSTTLARLLQGRFCCPPAAGLYRSVEYAHFATVLLFC
jgi:hypothetical protein